MVNSLLKKVIATNKSGYPVERNITSLPLSRYSVVRKRNIFNVLDHALYRSLGKSIPLFNNSHFSLFDVGVDLYHFFNAIGLSSRPWVTTYETTLPRLGHAPEFIYDYYVERLCHSSCRKLIAMSEHAHRQMLSYMEINHPAALDKVAPKMTVVHPPQKMLIDTLNEKRLPENRLVFIIIGSAFFLKGGREILKAFDRLLPMFKPLYLVIVSRMQYGDHASKASRDDYDQAFRIINKWNGRIHYHEQLPNDRVLDLLRRSHVALLPSRDDTYGFSVLEAQAAGCPVITTDIRALPEINNEDVGWLIGVPKDGLGCALRATASERSRLSRIIAQGLEVIVSNICRNPAQIRKKGEKALQHIRKHHDPGDRARLIEAIYDEALGIVAGGIPEKRNMQ